MTIDATQHPDAVRTLIWDAVQEMYAAHIAGDRAPSARYLHEDMTIWDSEEEPLVHGTAGLEALRDRRPTGPGAPRVCAIDVEEPVIDVWEDVALCRHVFHVHFADGAAPSQTIRNTGVWRRHPQGWRMAHNHEDVVRG
ncbi:nuclear transport factor 2 family protein [Blastococcus sp. MG754426]|uniref:YybH family protein n=1 Tax=unclassified Blastococcus TaxID=2619396 RepID=UPI001EF0907C|nr:MULTISPECIES: nuclear transport factor 2 family protein [unclassified Blastococcus]MCF6506811.1 nuclear transport factor 2 family protein [Blastococcus sp. MG754426]MCF6511611.1 nuclear transport factor 2 family protein [Blastococcus sp. MG754427]